MRGTKGNRGAALTDPASSSSSIVRSITFWGHPKPLRALLLLLELGSGSGWDRRNITNFVCFFCISLCTFNNSGQGEEGACSGLSEIEILPEFELCCDSVNFAQFSALSFKLEFYIRN